MSNTQVQLRRGTTSENDNFKGAEGELVYDTEKKQLRIHDGVTQGGNIVDVVVAFQMPTAENNYTWYRLYSSGWVEQGGMFPDSSVTATVTFPIEMSDTNYCIQNCWRGGKSSNFYASDQFINNITTTGYTTNGPAQGNVKQRNWQVSGMAKVGE